jgi:hypothetical protein
MSNVLSFNDAPRIVTSGRKPSGSAPCEVVIFPGVRFERRDHFDAPKPGSSSKQAGKQ